MPSWSLAPDSSLAKVEMLQYSLPATAGKQRGNNTKITSKFSKQRCLRVRSQQVWFLAKHSFEHETEDTESTCIFYRPSTKILCFPFTSVHCYMTTSLETSNSITMSFLHKKPPLLSMRSQADIQRDHYYWPLWLVNICSFPICYVYISSSPIYWSCLANCWHEDMLLSPCLRTQSYCQWAEIYVYM